MLILILVGMGYAVYFDSLTVAVLTVGLILYRAQRPSKFRQRVRDAWYMRQAAQVGEE